MVLPPSSHILKHYLFWLCLVFIAACGLSLIAVSVGSAHSGYSCCGALTLEHMGSMVVAHGLSCSQARGILPHQGQNSCPLPWPVDTQPGWTTSTLVDHQGSPLPFDTSFRWRQGWPPHPPWGMTPHHLCYLSVFSCVSDSCLALDKESFLEKEGARGR